MSLILVQWLHELTPRILAFCLPGISEVTAMINTKFADPREDHPDVQLIFGGYLADCAETGMVGEKKGANRSIYIIPTILHPKSRGYLRLRNNDPLSKPLIYPKYLTHPNDSAVLVEAIKFSIKLAETQALKRYAKMRVCFHFFREIMRTKV